MDKDYKTLSGLSVKILTTSRKIGGITGQVVGLIREGDMDILTTFDRVGNEVLISDRKLVEVVPYLDFKIDDLVKCRNGGSNSTFLGYFAGLDKHGRPTTFAHGRTSHTTYGKKESWDFARLAE